VRTFPARLKFFRRQKYKMSSVQSVVASPSHGARFFVATRASAPIYNAAGASGTAQDAGTVVRDMGKTIRTPGISAVGIVTTQLILRKVTKVGVSPTALASGGLAPAAGFVGFSNGSEDSRNAGLTFYINVYDGFWASA
jgi:hypothetical protein